MKPIVYLEWSYTPKNYFEEPLVVEKEGYKLEADAGKAKAFLHEELQGSDSAVFDKIHEELENCFQAVQIVTHKGYSLSRYSLFKEYPDGRKDVNIFPGTDNCLIFEGKADIKCTKSDGTVEDAKAARLDEERLLIALISKFRGDKVGDAILNSYDSAVKEPTNELIHLYEIREGLSVKFGGKRNVEKVLGISDTEWSDFGRLANDEPVRQGRHRGKNPGDLRNATVEELDMARQFAKKLMLEYLKFLDKEKG